jgi:hypothetical protein
MTTQAQTTEGLGSWNILNFKQLINDKTSFFAEAQLRSLQFYDNFHYHEFKGGVNYKLYSNLQLTLAGGQYDTYAEGGTFKTPKNNSEFRLWPQIMLSQSVDKMKVEQRYRTEMRWTSRGYRNRFRYRLGITQTLKKLDNLQIGANSEVFFTNREPYFERLRSSVFVGKKLNQTTSIQLGYVHQFDYKINDEIGRDFLQIGFYFDLQRAKFF